MTNNPLVVRASENHIGEDKISQEVCPQQDQIKGTINTSFFMYTSSTNPLETIIDPRVTALKAALRDLESIGNNETINLGVLKSSDYTISAEINGGFPLRSTYNLLRAFADAHPKMSFFATVGGKEPDSKNQSLQLYVAPLRRNCQDLETANTYAVQAITTIANAPASGMPAIDLAGTDGTENLSNYLLNTHRREPTVFDAAGLKTALEARLDAFKLVEKIFTKDDSGLYLPLWVLR